MFRGTSRKYMPIKIRKYFKEGCVFSLVISSEFRLGEYRDKGHRKVAPHFTLWKDHIFNIEKVSTAITGIKSIL